MCDPLTDASGIYEEKEVSGPVYLNYTYYIIVPKL